MPTVAQLLPLLGSEYEAKCLELGIIQRKRKIETPADLMLLCLLHLINGCSLVDISEIARLSNIADISDVAFMKKFAQCGEWFELITSQIVTCELANYVNLLILALTGLSQLMRQMLSRKEEAARHIDYIMR